jgi:hypothetical protein
MKTFSDGARYRREALARQLCPPFLLLVIASEPACNLRRFSNDGDRLLNNFMYFTI